MHIFGGISTHYKHTSTSYFHIQQHAMHANTQACAYEVSNSGFLYGVVSLLCSMTNKPKSIAQVCYTQIKREKKILICWQRLRTALVVQSSTIFSVFSVKTGWTELKKSGCFTSQRSNMPLRQQLSDYAVHDYQTAKILSVAIRGLVSNRLNVIQSPWRHDSWWACYHKYSASNSTGTLKRQQLVYYRVATHNANPAGTPMNTTLF